MTDHRIADILHGPQRVTVTCDCGHTFQGRIEQNARNGHSVHREIVALKAVLNDAKKGNQ